MHAYGFLVDPPQPPAVHNNLLLYYVVCVLNFASGNEGCTLSCVNPQVTTMSLFTFVRHGTSCKTVEGYNGTCLGQMCAVSSKLKLHVADSADYDNACKKINMEFSCYLHIHVSYVIL